MSEKISVSVNDKDASDSVVIDGGGFILMPELWTEDVALRIAHKIGMSEITEEQWKVVRYVHDYYEKYGNQPNIRRMFSEISLDPETMMGLFPPPVIENIFRVAGLPNHDRAFPS